MTIHQVEFEEEKRCDKIQSGAEKTRKEVSMAVKEGGPGVSTTVMKSTVVSHKMTRQGLSLADDMKGKRGELHQSKYPSVSLTTQQEVIDDTFGGIHASSSSSWRGAER